MRFELTTPSLATRPGLPIAFARTTPANELKILKRFANELLYLSPDQLPAVIERRELPEVANGCDDPRFHL
jgi:hypothetical protein